MAFIPGLGDEQAAVDAIREILQGSPNLVNLLRVPGEQQVMLMVTVAEVNRTAARTIGMDFSIVKGCSLSRRIRARGSTSARQRLGPPRPRESPRPLKRCEMSAAICPRRSTTGTC